MKKYISAQTARIIIGGLFVLNSTCPKAQTKGALPTTGAREVQAKGGITTETTPEAKPSFNAKTTARQVPVPVHANGAKALEVAHLKEVVKTPFIKTHQISGYAGYGLSAGRFKPTFGGSDKGGGMLFGADYIFTFKKHWALTGGVDFSSYTSEFLADQIRTENPEFDSSGEAFTLITLYHKWVEKQTLYTLGVPVTLRFKAQISSRWSLFASTGVRTAMATGGYSQVTGGEVTISGYYPRLNNLYENVAYQGYSGQVFREKKSTEVKINFSSISDLGFTLNLTPQWAIYGAAYFEYGLLNLKKNTNNEPLIAYNGAKDVPYYNFVPYSNTIDKTNTMAVGGKVGMIFTFGTVKPIPISATDKADIKEATNKKIEEKNATRNKEKNVKASDAKNPQNSNEDLRVKGFR